MSKHGKAYDDAKQRFDREREYAPAEAISLIGNGMALAGHFGSGKVEDRDLAAGLHAAVVKEDSRDKDTWAEYLENIMKKRGKEWEPLYKSCKELA